MQPQELFEIWSPPDSFWSAWAKPVLFANLQGADEAQAMRTLPPLDAAWAPNSSEGAAVIVDLPGEHSVRWALALAARGYQPVPLYNATAGPMPVVSVQPIVEALVGAAPLLSGIRSIPDGPPAFLLDSDRQSGASRVKPGLFDNRWLVLPQDFPSAGMLKSKSIKDIIVVQDRAGQPLADLRHVLLRWQNAGLNIFVQHLGVTDKPEPIVVQRPRRFGAAWYRFLALLGLRRNSAGGFGAIVPQPSSGGIG